MNPFTSVGEFSLHDYVNTSPNAGITLRADPDTKKVIKYNHLGFDDFNLRRFRLDELILQEWFQDNTLLFDVLLNDENPFIMCIFPPAFGKSTIARLLRYYLCTDETKMREEVRKFLDECQFQSVENQRSRSNPSYKKFRASSPHVLLVDFGCISATTGEILQVNYSSFMLGSIWSAAGLSDDVMKEERKLLHDNCGFVWTSLSRFCDKVSAISANVYIILESIDEMYNLIAELPLEDREQVCDRFTQGIADVIMRKENNVKTFCFGVSPYLMQEFEKYSISCHFIGSSAEVGQYFSYSDESMQRMIRKWNLAISIDDCKNVAAFRYNDNCFVNPYLCVSYLKSLKENGSRFRIHLSPPSLWLKCIFSEEDLNFLHGVLSKNMKCKFPMEVSMHTIRKISEKPEPNQVYYSLFVFGGFLSCKETEERGTYLLSFANDSTEILLGHHLHALYMREFSLTNPFYPTILHYYLDGRFALYCQKLFKVFGRINPAALHSRKQYQVIMVGVFSTLSLHLPYNEYDIEHGKKFGTVRPDTVIIYKNRRILKVYKSIQVPKVAQKRPLEDASRKLEDYKKAHVVNECIKTVVDCQSNEISEYAPAISAFYGTDVEVNLMLFYINHVILLNCTYHHSETNYSPYQIFASEGYFSRDDLDAIKNVA